MKLIHLTYLILRLNAAIDRGEAVSMADAKKHIEAGDLFAWLDATGVKTDSSFFIDPSTSAGAEIVKGFQDILDGYSGQERRKWGIENNGLGLLLAWTNELIQLRAFSDEAAPAGETSGGAILV